MNEFRESLVARCTPILAAADRCSSEEATKQFMVLPFLAALSYNPFDPGEVVPEHHADFSDKYKNRVDYAIFRDSTPIIAIEVKTSGANITDDRGQLRSYFNACTTVKLGILTNGSRYECFADTDEPNIMDQAPFLVFNLADIVAGNAEERVLSGIRDLCKDRFDPANIGAEARRKLLAGAFVASLSNWQAAPSDALIRLLLDDAGFKGNKTQRVVEECREIAVTAWSAFIERAILTRMGLNHTLESKNTPIAETSTTLSQNITPLENKNAIDGIITTETELASFEYARRRLAFLISDDNLFRAIDEIQHQDMKTTFKVFYRRPTAGILFNLKEMSDGSMRFTFPALDGQELTIQSVQDLREIDDPLLAAFKKQVASGG
ncbi:type I restriction endonuclease [Insolitispirillum peregrinum]|uniref:Type I restriction enzyme R protein N-terminal domain-containing protein n=1 Tax=Insolitispirillum peregrinum TaxID=80876 RepID=A0A1N7IM25_9PROT|nr:type I restriction endonuclease [Insolitispirillum peregrinum]SIS38036.1 hypothetical protein SAMN05421779_101334 [Insolitispirillum peregrinum]